MSSHLAFQQAFTLALDDPQSAPVADPALARALAVHRNTCAKAAQEALADNHPVLRRLCGDDAFDACAAAFVQARPPREPRLCLYGLSFDAFVAAWPPFAGMDYLAEMARLERLCVEALFAADAEGLDVAALAGSLDLDQALILHPATRFARLASPAAEIWRAHQPGGDLEALDRLAWTGQGALVTRPADQLRVTAIDEAGLAFLAACAEGAPLGEAAAAAAEHNLDLAGLFSTLITAGAFCAAPQQDPS